MNADRPRNRHLSLVEHLVLLALPEISSLHRAVPFRTAMNMCTQTIAYSFSLCALWFTKMACVFASFMVFSSSLLLNA